MVRKPVDGGKLRAGRLVLASEAAALVTQLYERVAAGCHFGNNDLNALPLVKSQRLSTDSVINSRRSTSKNTSAHRFGNP